MSQKKTSNKTDVVLKRKTDVHTAHCCKKCGCKYGEGEPEHGPDSDEPIIFCTVVSGLKEQELPCGRTGVCNGN